MGPAYRYTKHKTFAGMIKAGREFLASLLEDAIGPDPADQEKARIRYEGLGEELDWLRLDPREDDEAAGLREEIDVAWTIYLETRDARERKKA